MRKKNNDNTLVYSTEGGQTPPSTAKARKKLGAAQQNAPAADGIVRLMRETKGRKGKGVTLISGLPPDSAALKKLAKSLKQKCGSGGSVKNGIIEIQGEHRDFLEKELTLLGHLVKRAGG